MLPTTLQNTAKQRKKSEDSLYEEHFDDDNFSRNRLET